MFARLTGVAPGMDVFQWDLRYPDATEITGFEPSGSGGGLEDSLLGPQIVPGNYTVTLECGGAQMPQPLELALDPRSNATAQDLAARRNLARLRCVPHAEVDTGYVRPSAAEYAVFDKLSADAASAGAQLKAAIAVAR